MAQARKRVIIHGEVQGVAFRDATARKARQRGIAGWVANRPDGTVEAVFEGDEDAVDSLVNFAHSGPSAADVEQVEVSDEEVEGLSDFEVR